MPSLQEAAVPLLITLIFYASSNLLSACTVKAHLKVRWYVVVVWTLVQTIIHYTLRSYLWYSNIPFVLFCAWVYCKAVDVDPIKLLYIQLTIIAQQVILNNVMYLLEGSSYFWDWADLLKFSILSLITTTFMMWLLRKKIWPRLEALRIQHIRWMWIIPLLFVAMNLLLSSSHIQFLLSDSMSIPYILMTTIFSLATVGICYVVLNMLERTNDVANYEASLRLMDMQLATEAKRFGELTEYMEDVRILRHDMKHHLLVMELLLNENKYDELRQYLHTYHLETDQQDSMAYSANMIGDLIARHTQLRAQAAGIDVSIHCLLPAECWISDTDLCIILGNLMENALNACKMQREGPKTINALARIQGNEALITIENTCDAEDTPARRAQTGVAASNGRGVPSIQAIAKKYNGTARFEKKDGHFYAAVLLYEPVK